MQKINKNLNKKCHIFVEILNYKYAIYNYDMLRRIKNSNTK